MLCKTEPYVPRIALARVIQHINIIEGHNFTINSITAIQLFSQTMTVEQIDFQYYLHTRYILATELILWWMLELALAQCLQMTSSILISLPRMRK